MDKKGFAAFFKCLLLFSFMFIVLEEDLVSLNLIYRVSNKILLSVLSYFNLLDTLWFLSLFVHLCLGEKTKNYNILGHPGGKKFGTHISTRSTLMPQGSVASSSTI
jgi:hypothetical protein